MYLLNGTVMCRITFSVVFVFTTLLTECSYVFVNGAQHRGFHDLAVGGLFDGDEPDQELAFRLAVDEINRNRILAHNRLTALTERVAPNNAFSVAQTLCSLLRSGVVGIFGPNSGGTSNYVQSVCDTMEMPHIETRWDVQQLPGTCMVNLYPYPPVLARVYVDLVRAWGWKSFCILYENNYSFLRITELLKMYDSKGYTIVVRQLGPMARGNYRDVLNEAKRQGMTHFVLDCSIESLDEIMRQAQQVGLMSDPHKYIITNLDMHTLDLSPYQYGGSNITGVRLVDPNNEKLIETSLRLQNFRVKNGKTMEAHGFLAALKFRLDTALIIDAVALFANALKEFGITNRMEAKPLYCNTTDNWPHGYSVLNYIKMNTMQGLTGTIKFDNQGFRSDFNLDVVELSKTGLRKVGNWNSTDGLNISREIEPSVYHLQHPDDLRNRSFIVITCLTAPFGMLKETSTKLTGNDQYEGYAIDLIHELSLMLGFNYTFVIQEDKQNGNRNRQTNEWNGMIGEVLAGRADLAITDLTITSEREQAVDFTAQFMNLGISILYRKPEEEPPSLFQFTSPFSTEVWLLLGGAFFGVSFMLFVMGRLCPCEWTNPYPCIEEPEYLENQFSVRNCIWFTVGSLMQQGSEIAPIGWSTRVVAGMWYFFVLIMVSSYTANLAAFLTVSTVSSPFRDIHELASQNKIKFGAKANGATANFFMDSESIPTYKKIAKYMEENPKAMTSSNPEGVKRVEEEEYAFLMESTSIEYEVERHCKLAQIGGLLDNKGYGIAMRPNSSYRHILSQSILKLQETGKLTTLKTKWWKEKRGAVQCSKTDGSAAEPLNLDNVGGVFAVVVAGTVLACFVAFFEMCVHTLKRSVRENLCFSDEIKHELHFFFKFKGMTKTVTKSGSPDQSNKSNDVPFTEFQQPQPNFGFLPEIKKQRPST